MLAAIRSASLDGEGVGIMVTASHNPERDNGMKLADSNGGMLHPDWEVYAVQFANAPNDVESAISHINELCHSTVPGWSNIFGTSVSNNGRKMCVHIGKDTRSSSPLLSSLAIQGALAMGATVVDHGLLTTPMLHHIVMHSNPNLLPNLIPQRCNERGYLEVLCHSYAALLRTAVNDCAVGERKERRKRTILVDCACGVGYPKIQLIRQHLQLLRLDDGCNVVNIHPINGSEDGPLNDRCGAEFVQKNRLPPTIYGASTAKSTNKKLNVGIMKTPYHYMASLDGDADRIVFHYQKHSDGISNNDWLEFRLLDGDKISVLISSFIQEEIRHLQKIFSSNDDNGGKEGKTNASQVKCGIVQTAYANGSSTSYLKNIVKTQVVTAKTGVKYVHSAAHENFDIGVYFEANGHGTILFGPAFYSLMFQSESYFLSHSSHQTQNKTRANIAWRRLRVLPSLVNQAVGDALSDLLLVDAILYLKSWDLGLWDGIYEDMPSRQFKVKVQDRSVITTNHNETRALTPTSLQPALDAAMKAMASSHSNNKNDQMNVPPPRCFVRPSGTENVVRIYAEAQTQRDADALASEAIMLVYRLCGGVGEIPAIFGSKL